MNWFEIVNRTTEYIEDHITEDIILEDIAKLCHVSYYYFIKAFSMVTGYTLKEYIRNRRITLASYEVSNTDQRIIDIAIKYGYNSNESFSRAFKKIHGINPSDARKNHVSIYTHFPVLTYDIPEKNILSLSYDIVHNIKYALVGKNEYMEEDVDDYDWNRDNQLAFINRFQTEYPSSEMLYEVHHNISEDFRKYDFFVGYELDCYPKKEGLEILKLEANKAVRFISKDIDEKQIIDVKEIIYKEWEKNGFESDYICEIEMVKKKPKRKVDFYYIVSIH